MPNDPKLHFPLAELLRSGHLILTAGEADTAVAARLATGFIPGARLLWTNLGGEDTTQAQKKGASGDLTKEETAMREALKFAMKQLKDTAKKAFAGQDVKLHDEFQVGINEPHDTGALLRRGGIMLASAKDTTNAAALQAKGYGPADQQKLADAVGAFRGTDTTHEAAKNDGTASTGVRNSDAVDLCDQLVTIQNAATLEYPVTTSANAPKRSSYLLGKFPPKGGGTTKPPTPVETHIMTGCGDPKANGTYTASGMYNGKPIYVNAVSGYALIWNLTGMWQIATADPRTSMWTTPYARSDANVVGPYTAFGGMPPAGTIS